MKKNVLLGPLGISLRQISSGSACPKGCEGITLRETGRGLRTHPEHSKHSKENCYHHHHHNHHHLSLYPTSKTPSTEKEATMSGRFQRCLNSSISASPNTCPSELCHSLQPNALGQAFSLPPWFLEQRAIKERFFLQGAGYHSCHHREDQAVTKPRLPQMGRPHNVSNNSEAPS